MKSTRTHNPDLCCHGPRTRFAFILHFLGRKLPGCAQLWALLAAGALAFGQAWGASYAYVPTSNNTVAVINTSTDTVLTTVAVGNGPWGVAVNPAGTRVYVANQSGGSVSVIDAGTNTLIGNITVGSGPFGIAVSPDGTRVYVANQNSNNVSIIDTATNTVVTIVSVGNQPLGVAVNPSGTRVYVGNFSASTVSVIDTSTNTVTAVVNLAAGSGPAGLAFDAVGNRVYVANNLGNSVSVIDAGTNVVTTTVKGLSGPIAMAVNPAGTLAYVTNFSDSTLSVIDTATNKVTNVALPAGSFPRGVGVNPSGTKAYIANSGTNFVSVLDTTTNVRSANIPVSGARVLGLFIGPDIRLVQTITGFSANPASITVGATSTLSATKGAGSAAVVFSSKTAAICTVAGNTVTARAAGTCTVAANQAGDETYNAAAEVTTSITVGKANQTITGFSANPASITVGATSTLSATKGAGSAAVVFSSKTEAICTVAGNTVTARAAGTCTVAANQAGDETYNAAAEVTTSITVGKANQTITGFSANPASITVGATSTLSATKGAGSAAVVFSSKTEAICTVAGNTVTARAAGTCTVAANQAGDENYNAAAEVTTNITVGKANQTITGFSANPASITVGATSTLSATKGAGSAAVVFSSKTEAICTVAGNTVTARAAGTCTVAANQAGDENYNAAAEVTTNITVGKANQTITGFSANPASITVGATSTLSATKGAGSAAVVFSSKTEAICTVAGNTVTARAAGTCTVAANQAGDENYNAAAEVTTNITVGKANQTITGFSANPASITVGATSTLSATKGAGSAAVVFSSKTEAICTVAGNTVTARAAGTCTVAANQAGDETYNAAAEVTTSITVGKANQTITGFSANPASITVGATSTLSATKGAGSAAVVFSSKTEAICTVAGNTVTARAAGTCTVAANQAGDETYNAAAEVTTSITVGKANQTITGFSANPASITVGATSTLSATKGAGSAAVVFSSKTEAICTVAGNTVTARAAGTCTVAANQAGDENYNAAAEVTTNITVGKANQTITNFASNPPSIVFGGTSTLSATKGAGSAPVVYSSKNTAVCTVSGSTVTGVAAGSCLVAANQAADDDHAAAPEVTLSITVEKANQAITAFIASPPGIKVGGTTSLSATRGAGSAALAFSSKTPTICTVAGSTVTALTAGTCTVAANQAGDANHNAAPELTLAITVDKANQALSDFNSSPSSITVGQTATLSVTKGPGSAAVVFSSKTAAVCTVSGNTVTAVSEGTCTVAANQDGDANYTAAQEVTLALSISAARVNGSCGSANGRASLIRPRANLCSLGTASSVLTASTWNWTCQGGGGGSNASCAAPFAIAGSTTARMDDPGNSSGPVAWRVVEADTGSVPPESAPPEVTFPLGVVAMVLDSGTPGSSTQVTITYGQDIPAGARYWKFGPRQAGQPSQWYVYRNAVISGRTVTLTLTDGGLGDSDLAVNGRIVDPGGIGIGGADDKTQQIPTLSEWGLILMAGLLMLAMANHARRQPGRRRT